MKWISLGLHVIVFLAVLSVINDAEAVPRWSAATEQVGEAVSKTDNSIANQSAKNSAVMSFSHGGDDIIRDASGVAIGKSWNNGKVEWNCRPEDKCKSILKTGNKDGRLDCESQPGQCNETAIPDKTPIYRTLAEAVLASKNKFIMACGAESSYKVLRTKKEGTDGMHGYLVALRGYHNDVEKAKGEAPVSTSLPEGEELDFEIVAFIHNHPTNKEREVDWFSTGDAMTAKKNKRDVILYGCTTDVFRWLHVDSGAVTDIEGNRIDFPAELIAYPIENLHNDAGSRFLEQYGTNYDSLVEQRIKYYGYNEKSRRCYLYRDYETTPYNPQDWCNLNPLGVNDCSGIEWEVINMVGVKGWCKCDPHERGVVYHVGDGAYAGHRQIMIGDYGYALCRRCGRVIKPSGPEDNGYGIIDQRIVQEFEKRRTRGMTTSQIVALNEQMDGLLRQANEKLLSMPDGSVVAPGLCICKIPDPIQVGWGMTDEEDFYVCNFCGRIRQPDSTGNIDLGPTMLHEMGLMDQKNNIRKRISQLAETNEVNGK